MNDVEPAPPHWDPAWIHGTRWHISTHAVRRFRERVARLDPELVASLICRGISVGHLDGEQILASVDGYRFRLRVGPHRNGGMVVLTAMACDPVNRPWKARDRSSRTVRLVMRSKRERLAANDDQ